MSHCCSQDKRPHYSVFVEGGGFWFCAKVAWWECKDGFKVSLIMVYFLLCYRFKKKSMRFLIVCLAGSTGYS